jgi:hypothetical protein
LERLERGKGEYLWMAGSPNGVEMNLRSGRSHMGEQVYPPPLAVTVTVVVAPIAGRKEGVMRASRFTHSAKSVIALLLSLGAR